MIQQKDTGYNQCFPRPWKLSELDHKWKCQIFCVASGMCQPLALQRMPGPLANVKMGVHMSPILQSGPAASADKIVRSISHQEEATESPRWWQCLSISTLLCRASQPVSWHRDCPSTTSDGGDIARSVKKRQQLTWSSNKNKLEKGPGRQAEMGLTGPAIPESPASGDRWNVARTEEGKFRPDFSTKVRNSPLCANFK